MKKRDGFMIYRFTEFELDTSRFELRRDGIAQPIEPQVYELLLYLVRNRDRLVTRVELNQAIWNGRIVTDSTLNSRVKAARHAIGDDGTAQASIRTVPRKGYRFIAEVTEHRPVRLIAADAVGDVARIVEARENLDNLDLALPNRPSVAVLPFRPMGVRSVHNLLADGLTLDVISQLGRARWLFVAARGSTFKFRVGPYDPRDIRAALGVRYVVQGDVHILANKVAVYATLADTTTATELWAEHFESPVQEIDAVRQQIAEHIVGLVEAEIEQAERERSLLKTPEGLDAWSAYHRGCWHMYRFTPRDFDQAEHYFRHSLKLDPNAPRAYAGLSFVHWQRAFLELTRDRNREERLALELAHQSVTVDPRDPLGHWALGRAYLLHADLEQAADELQTSVAINPSSAVAQYSLAYVLMQLGEQTRSLDSNGKARRLSPYDAMTFAMYACFAANLKFLGRYQEAADFATRAARQPNTHHHVVAIAAVCNVLADRREAAKTHYTRLLAARPGYTCADYLKAFKHRPAAHSALIRRAFSQLDALA
jgi:TolB-like protein/DNA-binding winged helix-turn-helix (wHTH) protein/Tfp pilus assembly protein PilF